MLSRRNIRIKVMQLLYAKSRDQKLTFENVLKQYQTSIIKSYELYLFSLLKLTRIAQYAIHDASKRNAKLLPTDADKKFTAILSHNEIVQSLVQNQDLNQRYDQLKLRSRIDKDNTRLIYIDFLKEETYKKYLEKEQYITANHRQILLDLYKHCISNELFADQVEDHFPNWIDDKSLIVGSIKKTIKALPSSDNIFEHYIPNKETTKDFGEHMLEQVYRNDDDYLDIIEPSLKNWDADRVAIIDMILLKMAVCELLEFPTIPTKVTLNEFVEIAKIYSTDKSKDFINGILDRLMKKLENDGKINKEGRGLID